MHTLFNTIPRLAKIFSDESKIKQFFCLCKFWIFVFEKKIFKTKRTYKFNVRYFKNDFVLSLIFLSDISVLHEVFLLEEYNWFPVENPKIIIDLGAHFGDTALYYHARFPKAKIIAVEPAPNSYVRLVKQTANISQIIPIQVAVGAFDGLIKLNLMQSSLGHSIVERMDSTGQVEVRQVTLKTLFSEQGIDRADLIKFDIEGAEFNLFSDINPIDFSNVYIGELHFDLANGQDLNSVKEKFKGYNLLLNELSNPNRYIIKANK
jgi:FkbM family methyltransferase